MGLVFGGLKSLAQSAAASIAQLVGKDIVAKSYTATQSTGADAFAVTVNGARYHFGTGAADYASSDGTTVTFAGAVSIAGLTTLGASGTSFFGGSVTISNGRIFAASGTTANMQGQAAAGGASSIGVTLGSNTNLAGATAVVAEFVNNDTTRVASITKLGVLNPDFTDDSANPGNRTVNKPAGQSAIAAGAATCTITNSCVLGTSVVLCVLQASDGTATTVLRCTVTGGSFTLTVNANATGNLKFGWVVFNGA